MRDIRFRAKRRYDGKWEYGYFYVTPAGKHRIQTNRGYYTIIPETVGQFTGLQDKTGKDIYEGDILSVDSRIGYVRWSIDQARFENYEDDGKEEVTYSKCDPKDTEIIGNIHDNPELIKGGKQ